MKKLDFFIAIYITKSFLKKIVITFFSKITEFKKTIDDYFKQYMDDGLKIEELDSALLQMSGGKSPGLDGLTIEFYKCFWSDVREMLYKGVHRLHFSRKPFANHETWPYYLNSKTK